MTMRMLAMILLLLCGICPAHAQCEEGYEVRKIWISGKDRAGTDRAVVRRGNRAVPLERGMILCEGEEIELRRHKMRVEIVGGGVSPLTLTTGTTDSTRLRLPRLHPDEGDETVCSLRWGRASFHVVADYFRCWIGERRVSFGVKGTKLQLDVSKDGQRWEIMVVQGAVEISGQSGGEAWIRALAAGNVARGDAQLTSTEIALASSWQQACRSGCPSGEDCDCGAIPATVLVQSSPSEDESWRDAAVVVAIADYESLPGIPEVERDAREWARYLQDERRLGYVAMLSGEEASPDGILQAIDRASGEVLPGGKLWFVYSGHGAPSADGTDGLLVCSHAKPDALEQASLPVKSLLQRLEELGGTETIALLDTSFTGLDAANEPIAEGLQPMTATPDWGLSKGQVLTAAAVDQPLVRLPGGRGSAYSSVVLAGLRGDADIDMDDRVSSQEAQFYAFAALAYLGSERNMSQNPGSYGSRGNMILGRTKSGGVGMAPRTCSAPELALSATGIVVDCHRQQGPAEADAISRILPKPVRALRGKKLLAKRETELLSLASKEWNLVEEYLHSEDSEADRAVEAYVERYQGSKVSVAGRKTAVAVPELDQARAWLRGIEDEL